MLLVIYKVITLVNPSLNDFYMIFKLSTLVNQVGEQSTGKAWIIPVIHLQLTESVAGKRGRKGGKKHFINSPFSNSRIVSVHAIRHLRNGRVGPEGCVHSLPQAHWLINPPILWTPACAKMAWWLHKSWCQRATTSRCGWNMHTWALALCSAQQCHARLTDTEPRIIPKSNLTSMEMLRGTMSFKKVARFHTLKDIIHSHKSSASKNLTLAEMLQ